MMLQEADTVKITNITEISTSLAAVELEDAVMIKAFTPLAATLDRSGPRYTVGFHPLPWLVGHRNHNLVRIWRNWDVILAA